MSALDYFAFQEIRLPVGQSPWLDALAIFFAEYFEYVLVGSLAIFLLVNTKKYWPMVWRGLIAAVFARFVIAEMIRFLWARPRPFADGSIIPLISGENPYNSFPSGHATFYFALSTVVFLYLCNKKVYPAPSLLRCGAGILFFIASFFISLARVFVGVHWPTDVVAGAVIGIFIGWTVVYLMPRLAQRLKYSYLSRS